MSVEVVNSIQEGLRSVLEVLVPIDKELLLAVNGSPSLYLDGVAKTLTTAATWIPLYVALFFFVIKNNDSVRKILTVVACVVVCVLLAGSVDDMIVKPMVARWRPTHDPQIGSLVDIVNGYRGGRYGFFSAHASNTFSIAVFFCWLVRSRMLSCFMVAWSLINCWTRAYLGVHYPGDILVGLLWGAFVGSFAYYLWRRLSSQPSLGTGYISSQYTSTGYQRSDVDVVALVLVLTLIYALVRACFYVYVN